MDSATFLVPGVSCGHCVNAITAEVWQVTGVDTVAVSIDAKTVTVTGDVDIAAVEAAIVEAGYEVAR